MRSRFRGPACRRLKRPWLLSPANRERFRSSGRCRCARRSSSPVPRPIERIWSLKSTRSPSPCLSKVRSSIPASRALTSLWQRRARALNSSKKTCRSKAALRLWSLSFFPRRSSSFPGPKTSAAAHCSRSMATPWRYRPKVPSSTRAIQWHTGLSPRDPVSRHSRKAACAWRRTRRGKSR